MNNKYEQFITEDMADKPVVLVPGIGKALGTKLTDSGYPLAKDLYNQLQRLNYDEKKFRVWIHINCKGAKVAIIYKALMDWHQQFGGEQSDADESVSSEASERPKANRGDSPQDDILHSNNPLHLFFASFSDSCLKILPEYHTELKIEICNIVYKFEKKSKETSPSAVVGA